jgi:hypothetical protein
MSRIAAPELIAPEGMKDQERGTLALFLSAIEAHAARAAELIKTYRSPSELQAAALTVERGTPDAAILRAAGPFFEAEVDMYTDIDDETAGAMRKGLEQAGRHETSIDMGRRRMIRMSAFAGQVAAWQEQQGIVPLTPASGSGEEFRGLPVEEAAFMSPVPLPETM